MRVPPPCITHGFFNVCFTHLFQRICANLRREIGDTSVEVVAPAAAAQAPESNVAGSSSGDNASLYD